ncbi:MAG TPA: TlpA disulfide reductase family protein, partial [Candidatus Aminicenantes bacterium]|nr:TlpA disulfide reductase family protein [Candidatus Aminicenantes bacterium]
MKTLAASLGTFAIVLIAAASISAAAQDEPAPPFQLKDLQGKTLSLADYKGKVLFLNFWATWCPPCRAEIPDFIEAYSQYNTKGMEIL